MSDFSPPDDKPRTRRGRHIIRVRAGPEHDEDTEGAADLLDRVAAPRLRMIERDPRIRRAIAFAVNSGSHPGTDRNLGRALVLGLRACQLEAHAEGLGSMHRRMQNAFRKSSDPYVAQQRHEYTRHGAGQLEALLALGYCRRFGEPLSARLLRRWVIRVMPPIWRWPPRGVRPSELEEEFGRWVNQVRGRLKRMRRNLGPDELNTRADAAIERVAVFLRSP
jgi:hypothetical protein